MLDGASTITQSEVRRGHTQNHDSPTATFSTRCHQLRSDTAMMLHR